MPVCYGNGGIDYESVVPHVEQDRPERLPMGVRHGTEIAYRVYGCRCRRCADWRARDAMEVRKSGRG